MPATTRFKCDCGCKSEVESHNARGWFILTQPKEAEHEDRVKLYQNKSLYFVDLNHLQDWVAKFTPEARRLKERLKDDVHPRGTYVSKDNVLGI